MAFILIGFAALGEPRTTRQGRGTAMAAAGLAVIGLRIAGFALSSMMVRSNAAVYLSYALPLLSIVACVLIIMAGPRLRPLFARLASVSDGLITAARLRFARAA